MNQVTAVRDVLLKYLLPDSLKPEYDGMRAEELAEKVVTLLAEYEHGGKHTHKDNRVPRP